MKVVTGVRLKKELFLGEPIWINYMERVNFSSLIALHSNIDEKTNPSP